jgi:uncharacterized protein (TIGR02001 family)
MNKKIIFSFLGSLLFLTQAANAEIKFGNPKDPSATLSFNAGYNSAYVWRGIDQNNSAGSPYIGADLNTAIGIYVGTWTAAAGASGNNGSTQELDIYGGIKKTFGPITGDIGVIQYHYPTSTANVATDFLEGYVKLTLAPDKAPYSIGLAYYKEDTKGFATGTGRTQITGIGKNYYEANATYDFGSVQSLISYGKYKDITKTTTVTLSKTISDIGFALSYINGKTESTTNSWAPAQDHDFLVFNISKTF